MIQSLNFHPSSNLDKEKAQKIYEKIQTQDLRVKIESEVKLLSYTFKPWQLKWFSLKCLKSNRGKNINNNILRTIANIKLCQGQERWLLLSQVASHKRNPKCFNQCKIKYYYVLTVCFYQFISMHYYNFNKNIQVLVTTSTLYGKF